MRRSFLGRIGFESDNFFCSNSIPENIHCLVRMRNCELNRDQNLIGGQMAVQIERGSTLEPLWCNAIYGWTRFKFRFDLGSKL